MNKTSIGWVKNPDGTQGYTWNPITGCLNGCEYCYAKKLANTRLRERYLANKNWDTRTPEGYEGYPNLDPFYPRFWPSRIPEDVIVSLRRIQMVKRKGIFVCDMGELFGDWVPPEWHEEIFRVIRFNTWHRFYLLTKQPQNLIKFSPFPENCWVGATATDDLMFDRAVMYLKNIEAQVRYISFEPLLHWSHFDTSRYAEMLDYCVDWVIIGAQTKPYKPPKIEWVTEIIEACDKVSVPVFLKVNLKPSAELIAKFCGKETWELRQELPNEKG